MQNTDQYNDADYSYNYDNTQNQGEYDPQAQWDNGYEYDENAAGQWDESGNQDYVQP
jgi:hypothetical protein